MISTSRVLRSCYDKIGSDARDDDKMSMKRHNIFIFFNAFTYPLPALFVVKPFEGKTSEKRRQRSEIDTRYQEGTTRPDAMESLLFP